MVLDCANGVGALPMERIKESIESHIDIGLVNTATDNPLVLNEGCGAEFVHKEGKLPSQFPDDDSVVKGASFDGDADRLIYYFRRDDGKIDIIDGDKQFSYLMMYVKELLFALNIQNEVSHVLVNTAYANSKALSFINDQKINTVMVPTGVKNAHPVVQRYVIGANDEPNGHGTICVKWEELDRALQGKEDRLEAKKLRAFLNITNIYVGDAIANLLMIEAVLRDRGESIESLNEKYVE